MVDAEPGNAKARKRLAAPMFMISDTDVKAVGGDERMLELMREAAAQQRRSYADHLKYRDGSLG